MRPVAGLSDAETRRKMDVLGGKILQHRKAEPMNFDGREQLYMDRENLRAQLRVLA